MVIMLDDYIIFVRHSIRSAGEKYLAIIFTCHCEVSPSARGIPWQSL